MKYILSLILGLSILPLNPIAAAEYFETIPENPDLTKKYLFYLHGAIIENGDLTPIHPAFGLYNMPEIRSTLGTIEGYTLISAQRPKGTQPKKYAKKMVTDIQTLLSKGVLAKDITVVGFSKGGYINILTSSYLKNKQVNFVFLAACFKGVLANDQLKVTGRILSISESTDTIGKPCQPLIDQSPEVTSYEQIIISTGKRHGAFYQPLMQWVKPLKKWLN